MILSGLSLQSLFAVHSASAAAANAPTIRSESRRGRNVPGSLQHLESGFCNPVSITVLLLPIFQATRCVFLSTCPEIGACSPLSTFLFAILRAVRFSGKARLAPALEQLEKKMATSTTPRPRPRRLRMMGVVGCLGVLGCNRPRAVGSRVIKGQRRRVGARYYAEAPRTGPDWGLRFVVSPLSRPAI